MVGDLPVQGSSPGSRVLPVMRVEPAEGPADGGPGRITEPSTSIVMLSLKTALGAFLIPVPHERPPSVPEEPRCATLLGVLNGNNAGRR
jgi:hypothetical protein